MKFTIQNRSQSGSTPDKPDHHRVRPLVGFYNSRLQLKKS